MGLRILIDRVTKLPILDRELFFERKHMTTIPAIPDGLLPISKSRAIRLLLLGLRDHDDRVTKSLLRLSENIQLPDDVSRMWGACRFWHGQKNIHVGESATVLRFLWWFNQVQKAGKNFVRKKTLLDREITLDPEMLSWTIFDLLDKSKVPEGTSQLASAASLCTPWQYVRVTTKCPHQLQITYQVLDEWNVYLKTGKLPEAGIDPTIEAQAKAFIRVNTGGEWQFEMAQQEDFPFAYIMLGEWALTEAKKQWPSLANHESNRFTEVEQAKNEWLTMNTVSSRDHRVIQAVALFALLKGYKPKKIKAGIKYPEAVAKSWPAFYHFLDWAYENSRK